MMAVEAAAEMIPDALEKRSLNLAHWYINDVLRLEYKWRLCSLCDAFIGKGEIQHSSVRIAANHAQAACISLQKQFLRLTPGPGQHSASHLPAIR